MISEILVWHAATVGMIGLLILLAVRALHELLGVEARAYLSPARWPRRVQGRSRIHGSWAYLSPVRWPWPVLFVGSLALLWLGAIISHRLVSGSFKDFLPRFWERFTTAGDSTHYIYIAENGYARAGEEINKIVFYPLYPLLMAALRMLTGGSMNTALLGMILSQVCYGTSVVVFAQLAKGECKHPGTAILTYLLYPFGFFALGVFTEGLFMLLVLLDMLLIRKRKWIGVGIVGVLCGLTRTQGVLMFMPGVYCALRDIRENRKWSWRYLLSLTPLLGYMIYLVVNKLVCGSFFAYLYYQSISPWYNSAQWLGDTVRQQLQMIAQYPGLALWIYWPQLILYFIGAALLFVGHWKRVRTEQLLYGTAYLGMCYTHGWLLSGGRYMLGCVPMYFALGSLEKRTLRAAILLVEFLLFCVFYYWYMQGQAIM